MKRTIFCIVLSLIMALSGLAVTAVSAEELYSDEWVYLEVGEATVTVDTAYPYVMLVVSPTEVGQYTVTCEEALIGIVSYTDMWVQQTPGTSNVNTHSVTWECKAVGQSIIVGAETGDGELVVTMEQQSLEEKEEVQWTIYENQVTPEAFTFPGDSAALLKVNTTDSTVDEAVLGADGYYHLNSANGPVLFANVKDSTMSLATIITYGQIKEVLQDENNEIISKTDFNTAAEAYISCSDSKTGLYPLTVDLIEIFTRVGNAKGWYGATGYVGGTLEDAWMFACYYVQDITSLGGSQAIVGDINNDGGITLDDATALFYYVNGLSVLEGDALMLADINGDGGVNLNDATAIFYFVNGLTE